MCVYKYVFVCMCVCAFVWVYLKNVSTQGVCKRPFSPPKAAPEPLTLSIASVYASIYRVLKGYLSHAPSTASLFHSSNTPFGNQFLLMSLLNLNVCSLIPLLRVLLFSSLLLLPEPYHIIYTYARFFHL